MQFTTIHWNLKINISKTTYTVFTTAGFRRNYKTKYNLKLKILDKFLPLEPHPTFLGIKLDPKLTYMPHLEMIEKKVESKIRLIKKVKRYKQIIGGFYLV